MFILRDFIDGIPATYEESAMVAGASPGAGVLRCGAAGHPAGHRGGGGAGPSSTSGARFLIPFILLRSTSLMPASVAIYSFYSEAGTPIVTLLAAYSLIYSLPVIALYLVRRAGSSASASSVESKRNGLGRIPERHQVLRQLYCRLGHRL